jgi:hypothetical protein
MRKSLFSIVTASAILAGAGLAAAETTTTTTTTWTNEQGSMIRQYSTTQHYSSLSDPALQPSVGSQLPDSVTLYPLPESMQVPHAEIYSYSIINDHPVIVERETRRVVHTW